MGFCTAINCMDGRVQLPVIKYLQDRFGAEYVDTITEPGPNLILTEQKDSSSVQSVFKRLAISVENHESVGIAVVGHHGCAGNPSPKEDQISQVQQSIDLLRQTYPSLPMIGLWVDENWEVHEVIGDRSQT
ncbi:MAG: hypothetical protein QGI83_17990 [Candidatus Latescibacteria bacterium]|nr:hypothetical protein [Candidatus Latescibacterota bacterium]